MQGISCPSLRFRYVILSHKDDFSRIDNTMKKDTILSISKNSIRVRIGSKWAFFSTKKQTAVIAKDIVNTVVSMLDVPKYYGELAITALNAYSDISEQDLENLLENLIEADIVVADAGEERSNLQFVEIPEHPMLISIHPTHRCNLSCTYCYNSNHRNSYSGEERSLGEWETLLDRLTAIGVKRFDVTGGEPLLRKDLFPVYRKLKCSGVELELLTNGTLINTIELANEIGDTFSRVSVSLDSYDKDEHDYCRGEGSHPKVIKAMELLAKAGVRWQAKGVLHGKNSGSVKRTKELVKGLGGLAYDLSIMVGPERESNQTYRDYYRAAVEKRVEDGEIDLFNYPEFDFNKKYGAPCSAARLECAIDAAGAVYPCRVFLGTEFYSGNAFDEDFEHIWLQGTGLQKVREIDFTRLPKCGSCNYLRMCMGGCRAIAFLNTNQLYGEVDHFSCSLRKRKINNVIARHIDKQLKEKEDS